MAVQETETSAPPRRSGKLRMPGGAALRHFLMSFAAGLTAMGIVSLLRWLREPALRR